jgi:hypothetical protein
MDDCERMLNALQHPQLLPKLDCLLSPQAWNSNETFLPANKKLKIGFVRNLKVKLNSLTETISYV